MRCLLRNKSRFFYSVYIGKVPVKDEYGNVTGEYEIQLSNPTEGYANISAAKGETQTRQFGENESYDKVIVLDDVNTAIDEYSVLWIDSEPQLNEDGSLALNSKDEVITPYDYVVTRKAVSLNSVSIAVRKVEVS
jgi:hypothetical protein